MKTNRISRRKFLKATGFGAAAIAASPIAFRNISPPRAIALPPRETDVNAIRQAAFQPITSSSAFGAMTDVAAGWDGSVWGIDERNAPYAYDSTADAWIPFGRGLDAVAAIGNVLHAFMSDEYASVTRNLENGQYSGSQPSAIAEAWPNLPDTFKLGVTGAVNVGGQLTLIKGGLYVLAAGGAVRRLSDMANWPQTATWADGLIDATFYLGESGGQDVTYLFRGDECISVNFQTASVIEGPQAAKSVLPSEVPNARIDAASTFQNWRLFFSGTSIVVGTVYVALRATYIAGVFITPLPETWFPSLQHAPSGRAANAWTVTTDGKILRRDGDRWSLMPGTGKSISVGQDEAVFVVGTDSNLYRWNGAGFDGLGSPWPLAQVSVGDGNHVWVRDQIGGVHRYQGGVFTPQNLGAGVPSPSHIGANADGTLWHCNASSTSAYRFISESSAPSQPISVGGQVGGVTKVATTGFGAAYCVANQNGGSQLYSYRSPYVFKTGKAYSTYKFERIERGLGLLFIVVQDGVDNPNAPPSFYIVALDAHTGVEMARTSPLPSGWLYGGLTFDPQLELVYIGTAPYNDADSTTQSEMRALDARTLQTVWSYSVTAAQPTTPLRGVDAAPALRGNLLLFGDRAGMVFALNTRDALAQAQAQQPISEAWWQNPSLYIQPGEIMRYATPAIYAGTAYVVLYTLFANGPNSYQFGAMVLILDAISGTFDSAFVPSSSATGSLDSLLAATRWPPAVVSGYDPSNPDKPGLVVNVSDQVWLIDFASPDHPTAIFELPNGALVNTGIAYDDGSRAGQTLANKPSPSDARFWFGDTQGNLWCLSTDMMAADYTPFKAKPNTSIFSTPVVYKDTQGGATVLFGLWDPNPIGFQGNLFGFDPDSGNAASIGTGQTAVLSLSPSAPNGVVYAGGVDSGIIADGVNIGIPQVFGIRVDALTQSLHNFIVDSQMMQDPDPTAPGGNLSDANNPIPPSRARYQSHITLVNYDAARPGARIPLPYEPLKIWADSPTSISVNGTAYAIGPADSQFALVSTGPDGSAVVASAYVTPSASDTPDMYAPRLRLWAEFMDPFERIEVQRDAEFHARVASATANANDDNPDTPNLATAQSYAATSKIPTPGPLFTSAEISSGQPQNCATAIAQMKLGVGFGSKGNALGNVHLLRQNGSAKAGASTQKYIGYADLIGIAALPNNAATTRPVTVAQPTGLTFVKPQGQPTTSASLSVTNWSSAQLAIDALPAPTPNPPWQGSRARGPRRTTNIFSEFWKWLTHAVKEAAVEITHIVVSVADEVMVGIRLLVNGVEHVFKAAVKVLEDIAAAVGALFTMLEKYVEDVIAVMSVVFRFGEIIKVHDVLKTQLLSQINQLSSTVVGQIRAAADEIFDAGEQAIRSVFDQIRGQFNTQSIQQQPKMDATAHSALIVRTPTGGASNQAVPSMWGVQKLKTGLTNASATTSSPTNVRDDPLEIFLDGFVASLTGNGQLAAVFAKLKSDVMSLLTPNSARQFFDSLMSTLIDSIEALLVGALAVGQALVDGLLDALPSVLQSLFGPGGALTESLNIPVLSWLYDKIFGEPLSFVNVIMLVTAIPVTVIYRVGFGVWPSHDLDRATMERERTTGRAPRTWERVLGRVMGIFSGIATFAAGIANFLVDTDPKSDATFTKLSVAIGTLLAAASFPVADLPSVNRYELTGFGLGLCIGIVALIGLKTFANASTQKFMNYFLPILTTVLNVCLLVIVCVGYHFYPSNGFQLTAGIVATLPGIVNPLKLTGAEAARMIVGAVDVLSGIVVGVIDLLGALGLNAVGPQRRLYVPILSR